MQQLLPWMVATAALTALAVLAGVWLAKRPPRQPPGPEPLPVDWDLLPRPVFTADERRVYRQLREALPHHIVLAKLPLVRFCQPSDARQVRYWFDLLGAIHVTFAVCSANGRVLAAIDLSYDRGGPPSRSTRIKQAVMGACRVRYLRCPADHLPSIPELQLLVPQSSHASRGPQPAEGGAVMRSSPPAAAGMVSRRRERSTLWQDSMAFSDSFFAPERGFDTGHGELRPLDDAAFERPAAIVPDGPKPTPGAPPASAH
ncbi:MAG: DUF2726 domain-containing protein [Burkholderiaceae bacterium]|nr:DUF2726 domain-containing protein [Burkholderiaceae bacterium]